MTDDERFDERIRDVLGMAGADAPGDMHAAGSAHARSVRSRMLVVAASLALVLAGAVALGSRRDRAEPQVASVTTVAPAQSTVAQSSGDPTVPDGPRCTLPNVTEYDEIGTMHTVTPNLQPLDASVTVESGGPYCSGDSIVVTVTVHNRGVGMETLTPRVILGGGANKYPVADLPAVDLQPNESVTRSHELALPAAPPGDYWIGLYGLGDVAPITLANPPLCDETRLETTAISDGAMGTHYAFITGTNVSDGNCFIGPVRRVDNIVDGVPRPLATSGMPEQPGLPPLQTHVVRPGDSVGIVVATTSGCLDGTVVEQPIEVLALHMSTRDVTPVTVDLRGIGLQSACGFRLSDWGAAPQ